MPEVKDCDCLTHEGPHWRHMDRLHKEQNRKLYETLQDETQPTLTRYLAGLGFVQEEQVRLNNLAFEMKRHDA